MRFIFFSGIFAILIILIVGFIFLSQRTEVDYISKNALLENLDMACHGDKDAIE